MKFLHVFFLCTLIVLVSFANTTQAQSNDSSKESLSRVQQLHFLDQQDEIKLALSAGPEHLRAHASVYVFGKQGYEKIKQGDNGFVCLVNRDGQQRGNDTLRPTCWDPEGSASIVPVMLRVGELIARGESAQTITQDIDAGYLRGEFFAPRKTGIAYMLIGDIRFDPKTKTSVSLFPGHYMIYAPGVTNADIGINQDAKSAHPNLPSIYSGYSGGTHNAYVIVLAVPDSGRVSSAESLVHPHNM